MPLHEIRRHIMNALLETFLTHVMPLVSIENIINPEAF